ncbi:MULTISPECIES: methionine ABC transporter permease [unclassified Arthrobacter]|uniref:methionine ABC transporter permease n=1 Tax=unclassified Arthrobacter TaxID=235627 RepID=UPI001D158172|nr:MULTISPECIES: methionine ABC transporter permease [unclassified Arthrobacter]MCC3276792.1 ABC transporter permease [Arthrobacter sp. zg-Y20]MCC9176181.1 ABC transporter permease [Arthrobacter sp. zg-Y750]MDK1316951.1 methionine ABC transporter permease [Arthrobacter sp. zg.Y20]WIB05334.1 methionine ABC transporter permease [Arthrobacter sp. zg-Y20]
MNFLTELFDNPGITKALPEAVVETLQMVGISGFFTLLIGLPLGVFLHTSAPGGLAPLRVINRIVSDVIVNITRSVPFAILMVTLIPLARLVTGTSIGPVAASVSLSIATIPFFARLVENALRDVSGGKIDAALVMGSTKMQVISKVLLREALPGLVAALTTTLVTLVGYSAMAGIIGGGGLGRLAYNYGVQRFDTQVMVVTIVIIVALVQVIQLGGDWFSRRVDHRSASGSARRRRPAAAVTGLGPAATRAGGDREQTKV